MRLAELTFSELVAAAPSIVADRPSTIALWETRIARALASERPVVSASEGRAHRCDLARAWCATRALPSELATRALVCEGVRHALRLLLPSLAEDARVALPSDVYPVYGAIARERELEVHPFSTWPDFQIDVALSTASRAGARTVVLPMPLKLHGRAWSPEEIESARAWLREDERRRLVLDGVYSFGAPIGGDVLTLLDTDQVLYLDSLSKGWLHEQIFGVAIVPERDRARLTEIVRVASPSAESLLAARDLLDRFGQTPRLVRDAIDRRRETLLVRLASLGIPHVRCSRGYLVALEASADELIERHGVLALPASVFGSTRRDRSFASALAVEAMVGHR